MTDPKQSGNENDPKRLWQNQPREETPVTLEVIHQKAQKLRAQTQRELLGNVLTIPLTIAATWFGFLHTHELSYRSAFVVSIAWAALGQYLLHRGMWTVSPAERSGLMTGFEFYRREINRRRNLFGRFLQWNLGPIVLCLGALTLLLTGMARGVGKSGAALPFTTLGVLWLVALFVLRSRAQRELKKEIDQLDSMEMAAKRAQSA